MELISAYDSSPERAPRRPPPPEELQIHPRKKKKHDQLLALPSVVPIARFEERFLVHVRIPVLCVPHVQAFVRRRLADARVRLVGGEIKASFAELTDLHISVARPGMVRAEQIGGLVSELRQALSQCTSFKLFICGSVEAFLGGNGRRLFVAAPLRKDAAEAVMRSVVSVVDPVFEKHGLPTFFRDPRPHMSFAWTETVEVLDMFPEVESFKGNEVLELSVGQVVCSIGKSKYNFTLKATDETL